MLGLTIKTGIPLALLSSFAIAAPYPSQDGGDAKSWLARHQQQSSKMATTGKAIYFLTNDAENAIVALPIDKSGMLSKGTITKTGGKGSVSINGATMQPAVTDVLVSQSPLTVVGSVC